MAPALLEPGFVKEADRDTDHSNTIGNDIGKFNGGDLNLAWLGRGVEKLPGRDNWVTDWKVRWAQDLCLAGQAIHVF